MGRGVEQVNPGWRFSGRSPRLGTKAQKEENWAVMGRSCHGPCVIFKDEAVATPLGAYEGGSRT